MFFQIQKSNSQQLNLAPSYQLVVLYGCDDGMSNTFCDYDLLLIDTSNNKLSYDGIYLIKQNGRKLIRRLQRLPDNKVLIICDNNHYQNEPVSRDSLQVEGRIIQSWKAQRH